MIPTLKSVFRARTPSEGDGTIDALKKTMKEAQGENGVARGSGDAESVDDPLGVNHHNDSRDDASSSSSTHGETASKMYYDCN